MGQAAAVLALGGVLLATLVPAVTVRRGVVRGALLVGGVLLAAGGGGVLLSGSPGRVCLALLPLAGFALTLAGLTRLLVALRLPGAAAAGLAGLAGCALLVLPFLGDPLVEPGKPGTPSPAAIEVLLDGCPLAASVGGGMGVDFMRTRSAYGSSAGSPLSRIGPYYAFEYPRPWVAGGGFALAGLLLLWVSSIAPVPRAP